MMAGRWRFDLYREDLLGSEISGKILGLVGFGSIGRKVGERAKGFGLKILIYDPYIPLKDADALDVKSVDLETPLRESDFISIHARLTDKTRGLIDAEAFEKMKPTAILVNTARGEIIDAVALYNALRKRKIAGTALDVFTEETPVYSPLLQLENITLTPHIGSATRDVCLRSAKMIAKEVVTFLSGEHPHKIVNPSVLSN